MRSLIPLVLSLLTPLPASAFDPADYDMVDLSHSYDEETLFWPTSPTTYDKTTLAEGDTPGAQL